MPARRTVTLIGSMGGRLKRIWPAGGLWRQGDFLKLWAGQTISEFGSQVSLLALPLIAIVVLHSSAFTVAALGMVEQVPFLLFALPAGVWVDRLARRPILIAGDFGRALALASIPIAQAFDALTVGQLFGVAFVTGVLTVFFDVAYQAYLPSLIQRQQLLDGNSKLQLSASAAQLGGPGIAGALIGFASAPYAIVADAFSFLFSSVFVLGIRKKERPEERAPAAERAGMKVELLEGVRYVLRNPYLRGIAACTANSNFFASVTWAILLVYLKRQLELSVQLIGIIISCANVGFLIGALTTGWISNRLGAGRTLLMASLLVGPSLLLIPASPMAFPVPMIVFALMLFAFSGVVYNITQLSLRQAITPERLQGRMNSVMRFIVWGVLPLGLLLGGVLATTLGLRPTLFVGAAGGALSWIPVFFSPVRRLERVPERIEPSSAAEAAASGGLAGGLGGGADTQGLAAGAGSAAADA
jgi:MFS family permease